MQLLTKAIRAKLPPLYSQDDKPKDKTLAVVKFFDPCGSWTWYATEFDGEDTFFGLVDGFQKEMGYFCLSELQAYRGKMGLGIERDKWFDPTPLSELMD